MNSEHDPKEFARWWSLRGASDDKKTLTAAIKAGLVEKNGEMVTLTRLGKDLRNNASSMKS